MKRITQFFAGALIAAVILAIVSLFGGNNEAVAAVNRAEPLPIRWGHPTNNFGINASAKPTVTINSTNYTGITTNISNGTNRFYFANGILVTVGAN